MDIIGILKKDPIILGENGQKRAELVLTNQEHKVVVYPPYVGICESYLSKGDKVLVKGEIIVRAELVAVPGPPKTAKK